MELSRQLPALGVATANRAAFLLPLAAWGVLTAGCAGDYVSRTRHFREAYEAYDYPRALKEIDREADGPKDDRLLVLMDKGMMLHAAGRYAESIRVLAEADKLSQELDFVSVSEEAATLITNERERAYRGEDFEKLMLTVLQALNYAALGKDEDALVEVRRVNERIRKMVNEEKKPYEQLAIARYLGGVLYEDQGDEDAAFIDYYQAFKLEPNLKELAEPLLRLAKKTQRDDEYRELRAAFPGVSDAPLAPGEGEVLVVVEAGRSPVKESEETRHGHGPTIQIIAIPVFRDRDWGGRAEARVDGQVRSAVTVTSLARVAKVHLNDRIGRLLARQLASTAIRAGIATGAGALTNSKEVGILTFLLLSMMNQPDLRSWLSLPAEFQLVRFRLSAGRHTVKVNSGGHTTVHDIEVRPKRIQLLAVRRY